MKIPGIYCGRCGHRLKQRNHTGQPQSKCPACGSQRVVRYCDRCGEAKRVPTKMKARAIFCVACHRAHVAEVEARPHRVEARQRYKRENRDRVREQQARHYRETRDAQLAYQHRYQQRNRRKLRQKSKEWYEANRERHKAQMREWAKRNPEKVAEYRRRHWEKMRADPKRLAAHNAKRLERERFNQRLKAEREGRPLPPVPLAEYRERYGQSLDRLTVDTAPLRQLILETLAADETLSEQIVAFRCQIDSRRLYDVLRKPHVSVAVADRICVGLGLTFSLVYPEAA